MASSLAQTSGSFGAIPFSTLFFGFGTSAAPQTSRPLMVPNPAWVVTAGAKVPTGGAAVAVEAIPPSTPSSRPRPIALSIVRSPEGLSGLDPQVVDRVRHF